MKFTRLLPILTLFLVGCKGCSDEAGKEKITTDTVSKVVTDTTTKIPDTAKASVPDAEPPKEKPVEQPDQTRSVSPRKDPGILAKIDQYLVSTPKFTPGANGGISQATVTVKNNLSGISFQRVVIEVVVLKNGNSPVTVNYYTLVNLEPGESKQVTIPDNSEGSKIVAHVVKVTSNELTNGESVLAGKQYPTQ